MSESTDRPTPPYDDRQKSGEVNTSGDTHKDGVNVGGATTPTESADLKSAPKEDTPGAPGASPSDEQPASEMPETDLDDDATGPAHTPGTGQGQDKSEGKR